MMSSISDPSSPHERRSEAVEGLNPQGKESCDGCDVEDERAAVAAAAAEVIIAR